MPHSFYSSQEYRLQQSALMKENWKKGKFSSLRKEEKRECACGGCRKIFFTIPSDFKKYCSRSCAATVNNSTRVWPENIKRKISKSLTGRESPYKGVIKTPRIKVICSNYECGKSFVCEKHRMRKFCSVQCAMRIIGARPTSPRASRGKAGIRKDIDPNIYFYSRWEANIARLYTYLGISWIYAPTSFDIGGQMYTPDFYLPGKDTYIEVKNFWWKYSELRDKKFRKLYPGVRLEIILKEDYLKLEEKYAHLISNWEYRNTKFPL